MAHRVLINADEMPAYAEADQQLFNILYLILNILRMFAPVNGSSGKGILVREALDKKYPPADENRRRIWSGNWSPQP